MDNFKRLKQQVQIPLALGFILTSSVVVALFVFIESLLLVPIVSYGITAFVIIAAGIIFSSVSAGMALSPLQTVWRAVLHIDPHHQGTPAPNLNDVKLGRELVTHLVLQIYQFASQENSRDLIEHRRQIIQASNVVSHIPLPLFVFNKDLIVTNASTTAVEYVGTETSELFGKPLFDTLKLEFSDDHTLDSWIQDCQDNKVTDTAHWERVHVVNKQDGSLVHQCDISAYYNRDNTSGAEFIVTLFDRTDRYNQEDEQLSFVSMAVHELRTPITMLRGYIEVFDEELKDSLDEEMQQFVDKMGIAAKNLSSFVSNILNVARIEHNQLSLHLIEKPWSETLNSSIQDAALRAKIHGKHIDITVADHLPTVAVDQVSIYEVLNNIIDNAIKYSGKSTEIIISSYLNKEGFVETTIKDFGSGIPNNVLPTLFEKFARNHRTRSSVSGTGLGLYLSKAIVEAHGGQIWAASKEGEGSTFGFTLQPYSSVASELEGKQNKDITRNAHGWIKNHSLYR